METKVNDLALAEEFLRNPSWETAQELFPNQDLRWSCKYAEPGYEVGEGKLGVLMANWNDVSPEVLRLLETKFETEWCDEWTECSCGACVRTQPDDMSWEPSYWYGDGEITCRECIHECAEEYLNAVADNQAGNNPELYPGASLRMCQDLECSSLPEGWECVLVEDVKEPITGDFDIAYSTLREELVLGEGDKLIAFRRNWWEWKFILIYRQPKEDEEE